MRVLFVLIIALIAVGMLTSASAHKAEIVGNYKIELGWQNEPSKVNEPNSIELVITLASDYEKDTSTSQNTTPAKDSDVTGLADKLEVSITENDTKVFLTLKEDPQFPGVYHGEFTPTVIGSPNVHVYGKIADTEFERTFHPEAVEASDTMTSNENTNADVKIPEWVKNNAKWWSDGQVDDKTFANGIQFLLKEKIIIVPTTEQAQSTQDTVIPPWVKNNAKWWSDGQIDDKTFASGIQYLIKQGIISV